MNPLAERDQETSKALWRILPAISRLEDATDKENYAGGINPSRVVAVAWPGGGHLERARGLLEEGRTPPPYAKRVPGGPLEAPEVEALRAFGVLYR